MSEWFEGQLAMPNVTLKAPALLGFDESIDPYCAVPTMSATTSLDDTWRRDQLRCYAARYPDVLREHCVRNKTDACDWDGLKRHYDTIGQTSRCKKTGEPRCCMKAHRCWQQGHNLLNIVSGKVRYNLCRNLEWQVCAAKGLLPGQGGAPAVRFSTAPRDLELDGTRTQHPLGKCSGWHPTPAPIGGVYGYTNDDIFYLEVCIFNQICSNGGDLFRLAKGQLFRCHFSPARFAELQEVLLAPSAPRAASADKCEYRAAPPPPSSRKHGGSSMSSSSSSSSMRSVGVSSGGGTRGGGRHQALPPCLDDCLKGCRCT